MTHALRNRQTFTVGNKFHQCKLASLIRMKSQVRKIASGGADCFIKSAYRKIRGDPFSVLTCNYTPFIKIDDGAVVAQRSIREKKERKSVHQIQFGSDAKNFWFNKFWKILWACPLR